MLTDSYPIPNSSVTRKIRESLNNGCNYQLQANSQKGGHKRTPPNKKQYTKSEHRLKILEKIQGDRY